MFFFLSSLTASEYIEITEKNRNLIGGERPIFVKFYSPNCGHCKAMAPDFAEASTLPKDVDFGGVDCLKEDKICKDYSISGYPTIILFGAKNNTGKEFSGERSVDGFLDFIESTINVRIPRPPVYLKDYNPLNINQTIQNNKCAFITFFAPWCGHCKHFLPQAKIAAQAFAADNETVTIGRFNCDKYHQACQDFKVEGFPTIKLFKNGEAIPYSGERTAESVANFINQHCGTERAANGLLTDDAGIIPEMKDVVKEFLTSENKEEAINKAKELKADLYVTFMNRVVKNGVEKSKADLQKMEQILTNRTVSPKVLDNIKRRYNIFQQVLGERKAHQEPEPVKEEEQQQQQNAEETQQETPAQEAPAEEQPKTEEASAAEQPTQEQKEL